MASAFSLAISLLSSLLLLTTVEAQQSRAPHGLENESPMSLSPSAFDFFHPSHNHHASAPCTDSQCAHQLAALSASSKAGADPTVQGSSWATPAGNRGVRAGNVAAIAMGLAFVVLVAVGASYVVAKRRANSRKDSSIIKPDDV